MSSLSPGLCSCCSFLLGHCLSRSSCLDKLSSFLCSQLRLSFLPEAFLDPLSLSEMLLLWAPSTCLYPPNSFQHPMFPYFYPPFHLKLSEGRDCILATAQFPGPDIMPGTQGLNRDLLTTRWTGSLTLGISSLKYREWIEPGFFPGAGGLGLAWSQG